MTSSNKQVSLDLDRKQHIDLITRMLKGQGWHLVNAEALLQEIWPELQEQNLTGAEAVKFTQVLVWRHYASHLYEACRNPSSPPYNQAWTELRAWLSRQALQLVRGDVQREDLVQEALLKLQYRLLDKGIDQPHAFLVYALSVLRYQTIDLHRRQMAAARGTEELSVEESETLLEQDDLDWQDVIGDSEPGRRSVEEEATEEQSRHHLQTFFKEHLRSQLQQQVMELSFLEGLNPMEVASVLKKEPHAIRMAKARAIQVLRALPPIVQQELLEIIGVDNE